MVKIANDVEVTVGPHGRRPGWRTVRVSYPATREFAARVSRALAALTLIDPAEAKRAADEVGKARDGD